MLSCPSKYITGFDCPGCGFQRSVLALINGNLSESLQLYPATILMILFVIFTLLENLMVLKGLTRLRKILLLFSIITVSISYILKLYHYASA
jgi:cytosine/uracil/thiamine/allantoin permease